ncbi:Ankyrin-3 [Dactylella cylindrospora]|nr:Ankyrin-3 [Dactylella cylindrospora]
MKHQEDVYSQWTTKGDVYGLGKTIEDLYKDFSVVDPMKSIIKGCLKDNPQERLNSLDVLQKIEESIDVEDMIQQPYTSFRDVLRDNTENYTYRAFIEVSRGLDAMSSYSSDTKASSPRKKLLGRLELLLTDGAEESFREHSKSLHLAVLLNKEDILKRLLSEGQSPDEQWLATRWTAIHLAAQENQLASATMLLEAGANVHIQDLRSLTPIDYAIKGNHQEIRDAIIKQTMKNVSI